MSGPEQAVVLEPDDGSLGPLLRVADDRLAPGVGYGEHEHRAVDVVAVVVAGSVFHRWGAGARLGAGDVAVLRAGSGLRHDERAGDGGARVLQCYLRSARPEAPPSHEVHAAADGWVDLDRPDARLWIGRGDVAAPPGLVLEVRSGGVLVARRARPAPASGAPAVLVWQLDARRPDWAAEPRS